MFKYIFKAVEKKQDDMSFWGHVDALRKYLLRSAIAIIVFAIAAFVFKDIVFDTIIFGPKSTDFITYKALCRLGDLVGIKAFCLDPFTLSLINTDMAGQFRYHIIVSLISGVILAFPFIIYQLWCFVKPALSAKERKNSRGALLYINLLFITGVLFGYYLVVPLTVNFLATYTVSPEVKNLITLSSYISTVSVLTLMLGLVFELPVLVYFLTKIGMLSPTYLKKYRKHAIIIIFILSGFITPSTDMFSQLLVALPFYMLFEISIVISKRAAKKDEIAG